MLVLLNVASDQYDCMEPLFIENCLLEQMISGVFFISLYNMIQILSS